jgi:hypothetical protein
MPFNLHFDPDALHDAKNRAMLAAIFPGNVGIGTDGRFLIFEQETIPPKPWPKTVAGLPIYLTTEAGLPQMPKPRGRRAGRQNALIAEDIEGRDMADWRPLFEAIRGHFISTGIAITEVMYWVDHIMIVLEDRETDLSQLPRKAAGLPCLYLYDNEMGRPSTARARRLTQPLPGNPDNSEYMELRPGVRVSSTYAPSGAGAGDFLSTTAGVLVKDQLGDEFMTVASHGFPDARSTAVFHPQPTGGRCIGEVMVEVTHTDVALVQLQRGEHFCNVTFENDILPEPVQLRRLLSSRRSLTQEGIYLDAPDSGCIEGQMLLTSYRRVPVNDPHSPELQWIFTVWAYTGQDSASDLPDGICGSPIWTEAGDVLGFFWYAPAGGVLKDWCASVAADELIDRGFTLVDAASRGVEAEGLLRE